jgi:hypothetical protein
MNSFYLWTRRTHKGEDGIRKNKVFDSNTIIYSLFLSRVESCQAEVLS